MCRGITYTCGPCLRGGTLALGANAAWDLDAFFNVMKQCDALAIPLVFARGSLQAFSKHTLSQVPDWAETMLLAVQDKSQQSQYQKMTRFGMAMPLVWAFQAHVAAEGISGAALRAYARGMIKETGYAPVDGQPKPSVD